MYTLIILASQKNLGDVSHARAVAREFQKVHGESKEYVTVDANSQAELIKELEARKKKGENIVVISAGDIALKALYDAGDHGLLEGVHVHNGLHQYFKLLDDERLKYVKSVSLPSSSMDEKKKEGLVKRVKVIETFAVPGGSVWIQDLKTEWVNWDDPRREQIKLVGKSLFNLAGAQNLFVTIPGDAPDENGVQKLFDMESAKALVELIKDLQSKFVFERIVLQNGPRTGRFHADGKTVACSHEQNLDNNEPEPKDDITKYIENELTKSGLPFTLFNFVFQTRNGKRENNSVYNKLLYAAISSENSGVLIPGESTSEVGRFTLAIDPKKLMVFRPSSMNESHKRLVEEGFNKGYFNIAPNLSPGKFNQRTEDDSVLVAREISKHCPFKAIDPTIYRSIVNNPLYTCIAVAAACGIMLNAPFGVDLIAKTALSTAGSSIASLPIMSKPAIAVEATAYYLGNKLTSSILIGAAAIAAIQFSDFALRKTGVIAVGV